MHGVNFRGDWTPQSFTATHGNLPVTLVGHGKGRSRRVSLAEFFHEFDIPPRDNFQTVFSSRDRDFQQNIPMSFMTGRRGWLNLYSHYPEDTCKTYSSLKPDLGPKLYIATQDVFNEGSTALHVDATAAVNVLVYAAPDVNGNVGGARWLLWRKDDVPILKKVIQACFPDLQEDPIQCRHIFIDSLLEQQLAAQGARPFVVIQRVGDVIFIPAGVPHQVSLCEAHDDDMAAERL
ncbi:hypothetical protein EIP86_005615, partial [Pleurotus ostreatoroseus]